MGRKPIDKMSHTEVRSRSLNEFKINSNSKEHKFKMAREITGDDKVNINDENKGYYPSVHYASQRNNQGDTQVRLTLNVEDYAILKSKANDEGTTIGKLLINSFFERPLSKGVSKNKYANYTENEEQELLSQLQSKYNLNTQDND